MDGRVIDTVKRAEELLPDEDWKPFDISPPLVRQLCEEVKRLEEEKETYEAAMNRGNMMAEEREAELTTLRDVVEKVRELGTDWQRSDMRFFGSDAGAAILSLLPEVKK